MRHLLWFLFHYLTISTVTPGKHQETRKNRLLFSSVNGNFSQQTYVGWTCTAVVSSVTRRLLIDEELLGYPFAAESLVQLLCLELLHIIPISRKALFIILYSLFFFSLLNLFLFCYISHVITGEIARRMSGFPFLITSSVWWCFQWIMKKLLEENNECVPAIGKGMNVLQIEMSLNSWDLQFFSLFFFSLLWNVCLIFQKTIHYVLRFITFSCSFLFFLMVHTSTLLGDILPFRVSFFFPSAESLQQNPFRAIIGLS